MATPLVLVASKHVQEFQGRGKTKLNKPLCNGVGSNTGSQKPLSYVQGQA